MHRYTLILLCLIPLTSLAEGLAAVLNLKYIKDTGETAAVLCFSDDGQDCAQWATFYLYEAKVKKVLSGKFPTKKFKVIYGRHALKKQNLNGVVASLSKLEEGKEADYEIIEIGALRKMYCFSGEHSQPYNVSEVTEGAQLKCFEKEH